MAGQIFINYRRGESLKDAQYLATMLGRRFGKKRIFVDVRGIDGGDNWLRTLDRQVAASEAMVALIGRGWSDLKDEQGNRRIDNPEDPVRFEIAQGLARGLPVLPVLLDDAVMPKTAQLPDQLVVLTQTQAMRLRGEHFELDADAIARRLKSMLALHRAGGVPVWAVGLGLTAVLVGGVASAPIIHSRLGLSFFDIPGEAQLHDAPDDAQRRAAAAEDRVARAERAAETSETARDAAQKQRDEALKEADSAKRRIAGLQDENRALTMQRDNARNDLATERQDRARMDEALAKSYARIEDLQKQLTQPVVSFRDCSDCPEMVVVPSGRFTMGSPTSEPQRDDGEAQVPVLIARPYAVGKFAVTRGEFAVFATETGHKTDGGCLLRAGNTWKLQADRSWRSVGFTQDDRHPVVCISWNDAKAFAAWLSSKTGKSYRLPSEAEREYVTRAGTTTPFWWGSSITPSQANYNGSVEPYRGGGTKGLYRQGTVVVDSFEANPWGLFNVHGDVWEWTEDCWNDSNVGNPGDGTARTSGDCSRRVVRGGSWQNFPRNLRAAKREGDTSGAVGRGSYLIGFRLARTLNL